MHADAPARAGGRGRGRNYVLPLAIVLVVGQIAAFVAIKLSKDEPAKPTDSPLVVADNGSAAMPAGTPADPSAITFDAAVTPPPQPVADVPVIDPPPVIEPAPPVVDDKPPVVDDKSTPKSRREEAKEKALAAKAAKIAKEKEEKAEKAERAEREKREADERRREQEARRASDLERQRLAAESEKARLAAEKAKAEAAAEAAKLEAARLKAEADAKTASEKPKGSSSVLVLVLGPGVSSPSREAIKNVYLGKSSVWPNGTTARPMNRPAGSGAGRKFFGGILGMSSGEYREHWSELQLSGGGISPSTISSPTTMIAKVAATRGGMGYVLESELPENTTGVTLVRLK